LVRLQQKLTDFTRIQNIFGQLKISMFKNFVNSKKLYNLKLIF